MKWFLRHWYDVAGVLAIPALVWAWLGNWSTVQLVLMLNFAVILIHQFEEYRWPGGEPWILNEVGQPKGGPVDRYPLNQANAMFINLTAWPFYLVPVFFPEQVWLGLAPVLVGMVMQLFIHDVQTNIKLKTLYNPGLAAVVLGHVPLGVWYLIEVYSHDMITAWDWAFGVLYMIVFVAVVFRVLGYGIMASPTSRHPFSRSELQRWDRERRLNHAGITPGPVAADQP